MRDENVNGQMRRLPLTFPGTPTHDTVKIMQHECQDVEANLEMDGYYE